MLGQICTLLCKSTRAQWLRPIAVQTSANAQDAFNPGHTELPQAEDRGMEEHEKYMTGILDLPCELRDMIIGHLTVVVKEGAPESGI